MNTNNKERKKIPEWFALSIPIQALLLGIAGSKLLYHILDTQSTQLLVYTGLAVCVTIVLIGVAIIEIARRKETNPLMADTVYLARMAIVCLAVFFLIGIGMATDTNNAQWADRIAKEAATYAQENFEQIDRNQDGNLLSEEIDYFSSFSAHSEQEKEKLAFLKWDFTKIGHILEQHYSGKYLKTTYAINKGDLLIYKADYKHRSYKY